MKKIVLIALSTLLAVNFSGCELSGERDNIYGKWASDCMLDNNSSFKYQLKFFEGDRGIYKYSTYSDYGCQDKDKEIEEEYDTKFHIGTALRDKSDNLLIREIEIFSACDNLLFAYGVFTLTSDTLTIANGVRDGKSPCVIRAFKNREKVVFHRIPDSE